ncbi:MAG: hypothetical protein U1F44_08355 [Coriobacteriia bacterium]|nr:hypothetical protein [Coriobacteriia bacterium]
MNSFKEVRGQSTWYRLFKKKSSGDIDRRMSTRPLERGHFDHHSDYYLVVNKHLGREWARAYVDAFMTPSDEVLETAEFFDEKYRIAMAPTIAVCYRGTDKHIEVKPTPISHYFATVDKLLVSKSDAEVLIQTDQEQVRDAFVERYGTRCKYIEELPVTTGDRVLHSDSKLCGDRDVFAKNLYAMCLALSKSDVLVTHTGNVGFFLALHMLILQKKVIQFS